MIVFTYPGQGSQFPGMGNSWIKHPSWELIEEASDATHIDIEDLLINADEDSLRQTENAQLSTFVLSMLMLDAVERLGIDATGHAGHSLGEYSALTASASLDFFDATKLVQIRGNAMKKAIEDSPGTMAAVLGLKDSEVEELCSQTEGDVWIANYNSPGQLVIAGEHTAIEKASEKARKMGAKKVTQLAVAGAFHTPLMSHAKERLNIALGKIPFKEPFIPVVMNVDAEYVTKDTVERQLSEQIDSPVLFLNQLKRPEKDLYPDKWVHVGPGDVTSGMAKRSISSKDKGVGVINSLESLH